ncbi:hypothetical protein [Nocardia amikacinitolerans]|uniref:hypothetical protein n=1 Tax=Nocardia amikacinitolerans TaxID=756689 RepID=UPI0020A41178|nr:hypothetical protein [Nocardia amikacinitolerans]
MIQATLFRAAECVRPSFRARPDVVVSLPETGPVLGFRPAERDGEAKITRAVSVAVSVLGYRSMFGRWRPIARLAIIRIGLMRVHRMPLRRGGNLVYSAINRLGVAFSFKNVWQPENQLTNYLVDAPGGLHTDVREPLRLTIT